jgi:hypothetical protein
MTYLSVSAAMNLRTNSSNTAGMTRSSFSLARYSELVKSFVPRSPGADIMLRIASRTCSVLTRMPARSASSALIR